MPENNRLYFVITLQENSEGILKQAIVNIPSEKAKRFFSLTPVDQFNYVILGRERGSCIAVSVSWFSILFVSGTAS